MTNKEYRSPRLPPMTEKEYNIIRSYRKITVIGNGSKKNPLTKRNTKNEKL